jgi:hypothetical protein
MDDIETELVSHVETLINDCGTASETAEIAARLQNQIRYLSTAAGGSAILPRLTTAYDLLSLAVADAAGIADDERHVLDVAIAGFYEEAESHG